MIKWIVLLVLLLAGLVAGPSLIGEKGYVLIAMGDWTIEMSVVSLGITLVFGIAGLLLLQWLVKYLWRLLRKPGNWLSNLSGSQQQKAFDAGLMALAEGNYDYAAKKLRQCKDGDFKGLNLLALAEVEWQLGNKDAAREAWRLGTTFEESLMAATLCLIKDALWRDAGKDALELIEGLNDKQQKHPKLAELWAKALAQTGQWSVLEQKLKGWKKALGSEYDHWSKLLGEGRYAEVASKSGANQLKEMWQHQSRSIRKDVAQQAAYIEQLIGQGMHQDAEKALLEYQKHGPVTVLFPLFKKLKLANAAASIKRLQQWLKKDENNVDVLSTLGHLVYSAKDELLAEKVLAKAVKLEHRAEDIRLLAQLYERQGEAQKALMLVKQLDEQKRVS